MVWSSNIQHPITKTNKWIIKKWVKDGKSFELAVGGAVKHIIIIIIIIAFDSTIGCNIQE